MNIEDIILDVTHITGTILYEERGVGASKDWLDTVKEVTDYVASEIKTTSPGFDGKWHIRIPDRIAKKFDIFYCLEIDVTVQDIGEAGKSRFGTGSVYTFKFPDRIIKFQPRENKYKYYTKVPLKINAYSNGTELYRRTVANTLIHELNHKWDEYNRVTKSKKDIRSTFNQSTGYYNLRDVLGSNNILYQIVYGLFSETELNAMIASVYSDLESINSVRKNFKQDIKETLAYRVYTCLKNADLSQESERTWKIVQRLCYVYSELSPTPVKGDVSLNRFIKLFKVKFEKELDNLLRGIGRVASYYYDMQEESKTSIETH